MMHQSSTGNSQNFFGSTHLDPATGEFNAMLQTDLSDSAIPGSSSMQSPAQERSMNRDLSAQRSMIRGGINKAEAPLFSDTQGLLRRYL